MRLCVVGASAVADSSLRALVLSLVATVVDERELHFKTGRETTALGVCAPVCLSVRVSVCLSVRMV